MGYQETWVIPRKAKDFEKMLAAYRACDANRYYSVPSNNAAEPLSIIQLKRPINDIPAGTWIFWVVGDRNRHTPNGIFKGKLPYGVRLNIVPVEKMLVPDDEKLRGIDLSSNDPTENEYMRRYQMKRFAQEHHDKLTNRQHGQER